MLASAVVLPESPPSTSSLPQSPSLKRRQSSISSTTTDSKRPRLESQPSTTYRHGSYQSPPLHQNPFTSLETQRKPSAPTTVEERKRSQRLFGAALLGSLGGGSTTTTTRQRVSIAPSAGSRISAHTNSRRDEIEARQREKLRKSDAEYEEERRKRREAIERRQREKQKWWEAETVRLRHEEMRSHAAMLRTKTEPRLVRQIFPCLSGVQGIPV